MTATDTRQRLLIVSFSPLAMDARVLKQIRHFTGRYHITTCGRGPAPEGSDQHFEVRHGAVPALADNAMMLLHAYRLAYWTTPEVRQAWKALKGLRFDAILANDAPTLPLAVRLRPTGGIHADLHEYWPRLRDENANWLRFKGPWYAWQCRMGLTKALSASTVSQGLADAYEKQFHVPLDVVTNASPYHDLAPTPVHDPIRVVHQGTSQLNRNLDAMIDGVLATPDMTIDLYLRPNEPAYIERLRERAATEPRLTVHDQVPYDQLIDTLNDYDLGAFLLEPSNFSYAHALPNKIFDFAQARLGAVVSPIPEMAAYVKRFGYGVVTDGFTAADLTRALEELTPERVSELKAAAHEHAHELSSESQVLKWGAAIDAIMERVADRS